MIICECGHEIGMHDSKRIVGCSHCGCRLTQEAVEARYWARRMMKEKNEINSWNDHHFYLWCNTLDCYTDSVRECVALRDKLKQALDLAMEILLVLHKAIDYIVWSKKGSIGTIHKLDTNLLQNELNRLEKDISEILRIEKIRNKIK